MTRTSAVSEHIQKLDPETAQIIDFLRTTILETSDEISEQIKWNSPSFFYNGEMNPFNAKEYKRDIVVINVHRGTILLVFPTGARIASADDILEGNYPDGRKIAKINNMADANMKAKKLQNAISDWLTKVEK